MQKDNIVKRHRFLVAANIVFVNPQKPEEHGQVLNNTVVTAPTANITVSVMAKAQQSAQMQFFRTLPQDEVPNFHVIDVVLLSMQYMGETTDAEFYDKQEEQKAANDGPAAIH